ncbi:Prp18-domain-containing protein [Exidia glandulosa HHB12029]|uniref:Pre-mRNA-splicing factor 18 n=1 Tax=Exidia glandulosa HHB12029 TaxID=1314781 RepID=A0A165PZC3_EXIGL|nr:Prp18-domain-containing protein [Exidia glandulosa HHB12029]
MDFLKSEIANKRKALDDDVPRPNKYMRRGDLERLREEQERQLKRDQEKAELDAKAKAKAATLTAEHASTSRERSKSGSPFPGTPPADPKATAGDGSGFNISNEDAIRRLRQKGQPIRLFGESDKERRLRLRALELLEQKGGDKGSQANDFKKALEDVEKSDNAKEDRTKDKSKSTGAKEDEEQEQVLDLALVKTDPDKLYPIIYFALKKKLKEWEEALEERPENIKRSTQGKLAAATQMQSAQYLKPLFKILRSRSLAPDMLLRISEIVHHMQKRQYQRANDSYLRLSIGNAPWPIGVTMVGIHERSAREKISADQVAHVLNDEVSRKYIQSLKRILTFAQTKYPPEDVSQLMG